MYSTTKRAMIVAAAAILMVAASEVTIAQQPVRVSGTKVSLVPPAGFSPAARYPGFERRDPHASIMVTELPGPAAQMQRGMTPGRLASRGMHLLGSSRHLVDGHEALLLRLSQNAGGYEVLKWMLIAGDDDGTVMVVATFPKEADALLAEPARASLLTTTLGTAAAGPGDHFEGLPFRVSPTRTLKIAGRVSNLIVLTESGAIGPQGPDACVFIVGSSIAEVRVADLRAFAEARVRETEKVSSVRIVEARELAIGGLPAYEIVATAIDPRTGRSLTLYQVLLLDDASYFVMQGLVVQPRAAAMVPEFQRVAASFAKAGG